MSTPAQIASILYALGHRLIEQRRTSDAIHVFRTMLVTTPSDERGWLGLGFAHELEGHDRTACELYQLGEATVATSFRCALARARLLRRGDAANVDDVYDIAISRAFDAGESEAAAAIERERCAA